MESSLVPRGHTALCSSAVTPLPPGMSSPNVWDFLAAFSSVPAAFTPSARHSSHSLLFLQVRGNLMNWLPVYLPPLMLVCDSENPEMDGPTTTRAIHQLCLAPEAGAGTAWRGLGAKWEENQVHSFVAELRLHLQ